MKTKEELNALKEEVKTLNQKLVELTAEELEQVTGAGPWKVGAMPRPNPDEKYVMLAAGQLMGHQDMPKPNPDEKYVMK